jgi:hypothetical protein
MRAWQPEHGSRSAIKDPGPYGVWQPTILRFPCNSRLIHRVPATPLVSELWCASMMNSITFLGPTVIAQDQ